MRAALLVLLLAWLAACATGEIAGVPGDGGASLTADASGPCSETCDGCCISGICFEGGNDPRACGKNGAECAFCQAGQACTPQGTCGAGSDPCMGVTTAGRCVDSDTVEVCTQATGNQPPILKSYDCQAGESCQVSGGAAGCVANPTSCVEGATDCVSSSQIRRCQGGSWVTSSCAPGSCIESALGDYCSGGGTTATLSGTVVYERRGPNTARSDWGAISTAPAVGFLVAVARTSGGTTTFFDSQVTSATGAFTVKLPSPLTSSDSIIVYAAGAATDGQLPFVVADPRLTARDADYSIDTSISTPAVWSWSWRADGVTAGQTLRITEAAGSGAARVFDYLRYVYNASSSRWPGATRAPLIVWLGMGVNWTCGACHWPVPTTRFGTRYTAQIFIGGDRTDAGYWADAVTAHELGHWIMFTFGRSVGEGGRHCFGVPSAPGLAWSEGFATWFSADARDNPEYVDKQGGTMFWINIGARSSSGSAWPRPVAARGLLQDTYENEVSTMMWLLSKNQGLGRMPFDRALADVRMTRTPFERGYTRQTWTTNAQTCVRENIQDTGQSTTFFADFLDALRCNGVTRATIDAVTEPATRFPYPAGSPLCR
jgi:hypothetical protein